MSESGDVRDFPECGAEPSSVDEDGPLRSCGECQIIYHQNGTVVA